MLDTMVATIGRFADSHADPFGVAATAVPGLTVIRSDGPGELQYAISRPLVALVVQGSKCVTMGTQSFDFGAGDSMVIAADVPTVSQITGGDSGAPYYALVVDLLPAVIESLTLEMGIAQAAQGGPIRVDRTEGEVADAALRLLRLMERPASVAVLQTQLIREMHYWLLAGRHGPTIRNMGFASGSARRVARAIALIRSDYTRSLRVESLAELAGMSLSTFHQHFRAVTSLSPLQLQKQLRLIEGRRMMLSDGASPRWPPMRSAMRACLSSLANTAGCSARLRCARSGWRRPDCAHQPDGQWPVDGRASVRTQTHRTAHGSPMTFDQVKWIPENGHPRLLIHPLPRSLRPLARGQRSFTTDISQRDRPSHAQATLRQAFARCDRHSRFLHASEAGVRGRMLLTGSGPCADELNDCNRCNTVIGPCPCPSPRPQRHTEVMSDAPPMPVNRRRFPRWARWPLRFLCLLALLMLGPIGVLASGSLDLDTPWYMRSQESTGQAPDPSVERGAVVQVYGARIVQWRGAFGIHPWIAVKRAGAERYTTYHIVGWRARNGGDAMVTNEVDAPDLLWFGAYPQLLVDHRGAKAEAMIEQIEEAVAAYPWRESYRLWPGPNSNTFVAWVARQVPALRLDLPPTAIGKDYLGPTTFIDHAPSGTGWQLSLLGLAGATVARDEGLELNLLGLGFGVDFDDRALRLPGFGRLP